MTAKHNSPEEGYTFYNRSFESPKQDFRVKTLETDEQWAFQMLESSAKVDFDAREGLFDKLDPASFIEFPPTDTWRRWTTLNGIWMTQKWM